MQPSALATSSVTRINSFTPPSPASPYPLLVRFTPLFPSKTQDTPPSILYWVLKYTTGTLIIVPRLDHCCDFRHESSGNVEKKL